MIRSWVPALGERAKLTSIYASLLIAVCAALVLIVYILLGQALPTTISGAIVSAPLTPATGQSADATVSGSVPNLASQAALERYLTIALLVLLVLALISISIAWWLAGRVLRPIAVMAQTAREMSASDLSQRIRLQAPPGELRQLADTFDELLDRIDSLVAAQSRFIGNAAHELRTQLAVQRSAAEIGLADPTPGRVERIRRKLIDTANENEQLLEGLLLLAVTDQGLQRLDTIELDRLVDAVATELEVSAAARDVELRTALHPLTVHGDSALLKHLVHNLIANGVSFNQPAAGNVTVTTSNGVLVVNNSGPIIDPVVVTGLFEPFRRLNPRLHQPGEGAGLGLAIVASIARAHGASVAAEANSGGGLTVRVDFTQP